MIKGFVRCPKIDRVIVYERYCVFDCPNSTNVIAHIEKPPVLECSVNNKDYSRPITLSSEKEKLVYL